MRRSIEEIRDSDGPGLDELIEVIRIGDAYFVSDGPKRVAIAREDRREFVDANVSRLASPYGLTPDVTKVETQQLQPRARTFIRGLECDRI